MSENTPGEIIDPWPTVAKPPTMTIKEAIGLCKVAAEDMDAQDMPRFAQATRLGREALKRLQDNRRDPEFDHWIPLPGESEEAP